MPNPSKRKGSGFEREIVKTFQGLGIHAERVPLSGAAGGSHTGDIDIFADFQWRKLECKIRAREFSRLYGYMQNRYAVVVRDNRTPPLVVLRLEDFAELIR